MTQTKTSPTLIETVHSPLKSGLIRWATEYGITPAKFAKVMGYSYITAWRILRGEQDFSSESFGRFTLKYGTMNAAEILKLADLPDGVPEVGYLPGPEESEPVLVATIH